MFVAVFVVMVVVAALVMVAIVAVFVVMVVVAVLVMVAMVVVVGKLKKGSSRGILSERFFVGLM